jgi:ACS family glucarate transporter-like MFS transporter
MISSTISRVRWLLVSWLFVLSAIAFLDRTNISVAGGSIAQAYKLDNVHLGWIFSAFLVGYAAFQTPAGRLADQLGSRRVLAVGVIWWGIFTALTAAIPTRVTGALGLLIAVRFLLGAGEAVVYPASNQFVARWIPLQERGIANGLIFAGVGAGAGLSPPLITYLMVHYGWQSSFWVCAVIGLVAGTVWFFAARDTPAEHPGVSPAELALIQQGVSLKKLQLTSAPPLIPWSRLVQSKEVLAVTASYFCYGYVAWIFFSWFYIYLATVRGMDLKSSSFYAMLPFLAMAVSCPLGGIINDRLTAWRGRRLGRCGIAAFSMAIAAVFLALGAEAESARLASLVLAGGAGALYLAQSSYWSVTVDIAGRSSGLVSGFMNMGAQIGGAVTASLTPFIAKHLGWTASFLVAAALSLLGGTAWLLVDPERALTAANAD